MGVPVEQFVMLPNYQYKASIHSPKNADVFFAIINELGAACFKHFEVPAKYFLTTNVYWLVERVGALKNDEDGLIKSSQFLSAALQLIQLYTGHTFNPKFGRILDALQTFYSFGLLRLPNTIVGYVNKNTIVDQNKLKRDLIKLINTYSSGMKTDKVDEIARGIIKASFSDNKGFWDLKRPDGFTKSHLLLRTWSPFSYYEDLLIFQLTKNGIKEDVAQKIVDNLEIDLKPRTHHAEASYTEIAEFWVRSGLKSISTISFAMVDLGCFLFIPLEVSLKFETISSSIGNYPVMDQLLAIVRVFALVGYSSNFISALITLTSTLIKETDANKRNMVASKAIMDILSNSTEVVLNILGLLDVNRTLFLVWTMVAKSIAVIGIFIELVKDKNPPFYNKG